MPRCSRKSLADPAYCREHRACRPGKYNGMKLLHNYVAGRDRAAGRGRCLRTAPTSTWRVRRGADQRRGSGGAGSARQYLLEQDQWPLRFSLERAEGTSSGPTTTPWRPRPARRARSARGARHLRRSRQPAAGERYAGTGVSCQHHECAAVRPQRPPAAIAGMARSAPRQLQGWRRPATAGAPPRRTPPSGYGRFLQRPVPPSQELIMPPPRWPR